jgi:hypothetical protein
MAWGGGHSVNFCRSQRVLLWVTIMLIEDPGYMIVFPMTIEHEEGGIVNKSNRGKQTIIINSMFHAPSRTPILAIPAPLHA